MLASCSYAPSWLGGAEHEKPKLAGERKEALTSISSIQADKTISNAQMLPQVSFNNNWEKNSSISGNLALAKSLSKHSASIGGGNDFSHSLIPAPVVSGGLVFVMDSAGIISAHDAGNIDTIRWKSEEIADEDEREVIGGGLTISSGMLYATSGQGMVAAFNSADGKLLWKKNLAFPLRGSPRASADRVVITTIDNQSYGLSAKTGDILWNHRGINETASVMNNVSATIISNDVLIPYSSGELFAVSLADGREHWSDSLMQNRQTLASSVFSGIGGDPLVEGSVVFITGNNGLTTALDMNQGRRLWQVQAGSINSPWLAGSDVFVLATDSNLLAIEKATGKVRWVTQLASFEDMKSKRRPITWRGPVLTSSGLVVVSTSGEMNFIDSATGSISSTVDIPDNIMTPPVVAGGKIYLVGQDATLYSFE
jgi:outer membrane protein assembly factor BamB